MTDADKHLDQFLAKKIQTGETLSGSIKGYIPSRKKESTDALMTGRLILTDRRICYIRRGIIGEKFESIDLPNVKSIETGYFLKRNSLKLYSTHNDLTFNSFKPKQEFDTIISMIEQRLSAQSDAAVPTGVRDTSPTQQLEKLAELHQSGILTEKEFLSKKTEILKRI